MCVLGWIKGRGKESATVGVKSELPTIKMRLLLNSGSIFRSKGILRSILRLIGFHKSKDAEDQMLQKIT